MAYIQPTPINKFILNLILGYLSVILISIFTLRGAVQDANSKETATEEQVPAADETPVNLQDAVLEEQEDTPLRAYSGSSASGLLEGEHVV